MKNRSRLNQTWTIARIELRRAFFSKRAFWVYALALFPSLIFFGNSLQVKFRRMSLASNGLKPPAMLDSLKTGESAEAILKRVGKPSSDYEWEASRRIRDVSESSGITIHKIDPSYQARYVRLNIAQSTYEGDNRARIYEMEVYGDGPANLALNRPATSSTPCSADEGDNRARIYEMEVYGDGTANLALNRPATSSTPCSADEGPEKAFNGSVQGGPSDRWCGTGWQRYLQVDLGELHPITRVVIKHASAGGEGEELNTALFHIQASKDNKTFVTVVNGTGARLVDEITSRRRMEYFDGQRVARLDIRDGKLHSVDIHPLVNFEEDRAIFARVFQFFYLRLAIFFGCLGIFMNLFRGEMLDKTLHYWFLAPARREVLLAGKYSAGLIASTIIFTGGALLCFAVLIWTHNPVEVQAYWHSGGMAHAFWYAAASVLGCIGYGSVFLAAGLLMRNPILPAAVILGWEGINGFLPEILQKLSVLYYLQSLCPVPAPMEEDTPALLKLLLVPAEPASRAGAILGLLLVTAAVLWIACLAIRRMQVSYSTET